MDKLMALAMFVGAGLVWANDVYGEDYPAEWGFDDGLTWYCTKPVNGEMHCENDQQALKRQCITVGTDLRCTDPVLICTGSKCAIKI